MLLYSIFGIAVLSFLWTVGIWNQDMSGFQMVNLCQSFEWSRFRMVHWPRLFFYYIVNWRINKLLFQHNLYSGAKHIDITINACYMWQAIILVKGLKPKSYETPSFIAGLFSNFTTVKMKGPKKPFKFKKLDFSNIFCKKKFFQFLWSQKPDRQICLILADLTIHAKSASAHHLGLNQENLDI